MTAEKQDEARRRTAGYRPRCDDDDGHPAHWWPNRPGAASRWCAGADAPRGVPAPSRDPEPGETCGRCSTAHGEEMRGEPFLSCATGEHADCYGCVMVSESRRWEACGCQCHRLVDAPRGGSRDDGPLLAGCGSVERHTPHWYGRPSARTPGAESARFCGGNPAAEPPLRSTLDQAAAVEVAALGLVRVALRYDNPALRDAAVAVCDALGVETPASDGEIRCAKCTCPELEHKAVQP